MKRLPALLLGAALALVCAMPAQAQPVIGLRSLGYQQMTSLSAATPLPSVPSGTLEAFVVCTGATVYWRDDNTAPTASVGMPLTINTPFPYIGSMLWLQFIQSGGAAVCNVTYYGY